MRHKKPENWLSAVARNGHGLTSETPLAPHARATEALLMGLRLREGVDLGRIAALGAADIDHIVDAAATHKLADQGLLTRTADRLIVTDAGMLLLDAILPEVVLSAP